MLIPNAMSACTRLFWLLLQHREIAESEKASTNLRLNETQKGFLLPAQCAIALYSLKIVAILLALPTEFLCRCFCRYYLGDIC